MVMKKEEVDFRIKAKLYLVRNVHFEECPACGEKVLAPETIQDLYKKIKNREFVEETLKIPVLKGT
jgi:YgiT-type zinc finger domain-containing protein